MSANDLKGEDLLRAMGRAILAELRAIRAALEPRSGAPRQATPATSQQAVVAVPPAIAPDRDLDGPYGDFVVKVSPRDWHGDDMRGKKLSECPPEFLEELAKLFDYFARNAERDNEQTDGGKPVADFKRKDAARARGWAKRLRERGPAAAAPKEDDWRAPSDW